MKKVLFEQYIAPLLEPDIKLHSLETLLDLAYRAFIYNINTEDLLKTIYVKRILNIISNHVISKDLVADLFTYIIKNQEYHAPKKVNRILSKKSDTEEGEVSIQIIEEYKILFETFLRDFLSLIYVYTFIVSKEGINETAKEIYHKGTDKKIKRLEEISKDDKNLRVFLDLVNTDVRNSIAHERWKLLDDSKIELQPLNNGQTKSMIFTSAQLKEQLENLEKLIWILRAGFFTFLENTNFKITSVYFEEYTKKEIEDMASVVDEKVLELSEFQWGDEDISISIKNKVQERFTGGEIYTPQGVYEILVCIEKLSYIRRCLGAISGILKYFEYGDKAKYKTFNLKLTCNDVYLGEFKIDKNKLKEINDVAQKNVNKANSMVDDLCEGLNIDSTLLIEVKSEQTLPYGQKAIQIASLKKQFGDSIELF